jgi:hypothetical protein
LLPIIRLWTNEDQAFIERRLPRRITSLITPDRWLKDFAEINIREEVRPLILKENAMRLFGLT